VRRNPQELLRGAALRVTAGRGAVLEALEQAPHSDADQVFKAISDHLPTTSIQSVHNILNDFVRTGLARRIEPAGLSARYDLRVGDNHHHVVCRSCGRIEDVDCLVGEAPCLRPTHDHGFRIDEAEVTFWGLCPNCPSPK